ncbi:hypothetical protein [Azospirillum picis]|uniref:Uncharacterized protein n=1 Tax=Azospirillum picis TaxID=488438 RepID=A0ABU0MIY6_9PROT|nr:hypothetical protein [Azospirillum picis]MBP2299501.1 hypothetical protein [Azospirillum picis]MDQ0533372.1 hypothetical protein [Azospirillum picis]
MSKTAAPGLHIDDRMVVAAALDRILYDDHDRFAAEDARMVRRMIPHSRSSWLRLGFRAETQGPSMKGEAAGVGDVRMEGDKKVMEGSVGESATWRCGQYKITNHGTDLEIWQVMSDEYAPEPKGARLEFDVQGEPERLTFFQPRDIELRIPFTSLAIGVRLGGWQPWKLVAS